MRLRVTIDIFSGRPNPIVELDGDEAEGLIARVSSVQPFTQGGPLMEPSKLGYRGLIIEQIQPEPVSHLPLRWRVASSKEARSLRPSQAASEVEQLLFEPGGPIARKIDSTLADFCRAEAMRLREDAPFAQNLAMLFSPAVVGMIGEGCYCAPIYEPEWWNDGAERQLLNNCYNYSTNYRTNTFAQPGRGAGVLLTAVTCGGVKPLALLDGLIEVPWQDNQCPRVGNVVALVIAPGFDFHWYRKGWGGLWSHKVGSGPATNKDNAGNLILDPRLAARGPYIDFCGFLVVKDGHIKLN